MDRHGHWIDGLTSSPINVHLSPKVRNWYERLNWLLAHSWFLEMVATHHRYKLANARIGCSPAKYHHYCQISFLRLWFLMTTGIWLPSRSDFAHHRFVRCCSHWDLKDARFSLKSKMLALNIQADAHEYSMSPVYCFLIIPNVYPIKKNWDQSSILQRKSHDLRLD